MNVVQELPENEESPTPKSQSKAKMTVVINRRNCGSLNMDQIGQTNTQPNETEHRDYSLNIKFEVDEERLKTDSDERQKTEERRLLKLEVEGKTKV